jgi:hypothetical protein
VLCKDDWTILKRFCCIINVELTIYTILSDHEYERVEFCSPKSGIVVDVYQRLTSAGALELGLLYHGEQVKTDNMQALVLTSYPICMQRPL